MFMLLVDFTIKLEFSEQFNPVVIKQAQNSLDKEKECHFFEVTRSVEDPNQYTLSEVYTNAAAFEEHLKTEHFLKFDALVKDWVDKKTVRSLE